MSRAPKNFYQIPVLAGFFLLAWGLFSQGSAQSHPIFFAQLDQTRLQVGARAVLTVSLEGEDIELGAGVELPRLSPYFQIEGQRGPSVQTEMSIINGKMTKRVSWTMQYILVAVKPGMFTIPRMSFHSRGQVYYTNPIQVEITEAKALSEQSPIESKEWAPPTDPYLKLELDRAEYYQGEQILASWYLYYQEQPYNLRLGMNPALADFNALEMESASQLSPVSKTLRGKQWNAAFIRSMALFPLKSGKLSIGALELRYERSTGQRDFFGMPILEEYPLRSEPVAVIVKPLPPDAPTDFSGAVGQFSLTARLSRSEARVGESINLELEITGNGNPDYILEPKFDFPASFEVYPPEVKLEKEISAGRLVSHKRFNYVLVARQEGEFQIPEIGFRYFEPKSGRYQLAQSPSLKIKVYPGSIAPPAGQASIKPSGTKIQTDIRYLKLGLKEFPDQSAGVFAKGWFWLSHLLGLVLMGLAFWYRAYQSRLLSDRGFARKQRAFKRFRKQLKKAHSLSLTQSYDQFASSLRHSLLEYFGDRFNQSPWGLLEEDMREIMAKEKIPEEISREFLELLQKLAQAQYAGKMDVEPLEMLQRSEKLVQAIEKSAK